MKYPQLVSDRAVSTISDWLVTRLEVLGVEAPIVYSRLLLSLLHTPLQVDSVDLADIPQLKNWLGKRFNSRRLTQSDAERLKRVAAIESLMDVVEANEKRSRIVELVSELCGKLRDLERAEDQQEFEQVIERQEPVVKTTMNSSGGGGVGGSSVASGAKTKETVTKAARSNKSNPYYQMFPALSGNIPASNSSSRATSISGGVLRSESSTSGNWGGRGDAQQLKVADAATTLRIEAECDAFERQRRQSERMIMTTTVAQELHVTGADGGNKGGSSSKRKNKKRRTNGPSAVPPPDNNNNSNSKKGPTAVAVQPHPQSVASCGTNRKKQPYVEWDTNFSGQWEMEERNPVQEFMKAQRTATTTTTTTSTSDNDCESVASGSVRASGATLTANVANNGGYDNVFKMKRSDVNEVQTMLIKNFLTQNQSTPSQKSNNLTTATKQQQHHHETVMGGQYERNEMPPPPTFGFGFDAAEEYFNLSLTEEEQGDTHRRLFEREVSSESLTGSSGGFPYGAAVTDMIEEPTTEFDAKLDAFKAKFDTNIRNLWSQDAVGMEGGEEEQDQHQQPMSVNSFWQNYNKHLYEFQDNHGPAESFSSVGGGGGGWPQARMEEQQHLFHDQLGQKQAPALAIWSNNEFEDTQTSNLHAYNEHMAAAYNKQLAYGSGGGGGCLDNNEHIDPFAAAAGSWSTTSDCTAEGVNYDVLMNNDELEQLYYSSGFPSVGDLQSFVGLHQDALMESIDNNNNNHDPSEVVANIVKLEQSIAMINHSSTSSFAKVDKKMLGSVAAVNRGGGGSSSSSDGAGQNGARGGSLSASSSSTAITNMSSLYGSFKQNSMENLLTSERTHFRPIKQAYVDGHTFDIPCSPDTIEYVRSKSGSLFFELDKYMEYNVEPVVTKGRKSVADLDDDDHLPQSSTNVPISRCGTIVSASEEGEQEEEEEEQEAQSKDPPSSNAKKFTLKFCVREENEKCCQTEIIDYEMLMLRRLSSATTLADSGHETVNKYPKHVLANVSTLVEDVEAEEVAYEVDSKWGGISSSAAQNMSLLWENSDSTSLDSSLNYESLPANRLLRDELSADAEEILKDSLTYMQNLYIDDMEEEEEGEQAAQRQCNGMGMGESELGRSVNELKKDMDLANYYEMGQLISEILNPGAVQKISQAGAGSVEDILWYKNWSQKNWLPTILDQSAAVVSSLCKDTGNVWHYGSGSLTMNSNSNNNNSVEVNNNNINNTIHNNSHRQRREEEGVVEEDLPLTMNWSSEKGATPAEEAEDWKFSNLRMLWNDTQLILNEGSAGEQLSGLVIPVEGEGEEEEDDLLDGEKDYHLIIFEKNGPTVAAAKGRKRRHSASQNLYDEDLEFFNGDDVKWYDYCCKCDCGKRSEKILKYRNKLLMKRVDNMGYVHNASLLLKNFSKQFDSIDEILNEGLICNAMASGMAELCEYEVEGGEGIASEYCAEKLCANMDQVSMLKNPNMYLNRTALISMARPLTR